MNSTRRIATSWRNHQNLQHAAGKKNHQNLQHPAGRNHQNLQRAAGYTLITQISKLWSPITWKNKSSRLFIIWNIRKHQDAQCSTFKETIKTLISKYKKKNNQNIQQELYKLLSIIQQTSKLRKYCKVN